MEYLSEIRRQCVDRLTDTIGSDVSIEPFYSEDGRELIEWLSDNERSVARYPHVLVAPTRADQIADRGTGLELADDVNIVCWVIAHNVSDEDRQFVEAEKWAMLARAYLSGFQIGTTYTNSNDITDWQINLEVETDEICVYSVIGTLELELDLAQLQQDYEST